MKLRTHCPAVLIAAFALLGSAALAPTGASAEVSQDGDATTLAVANYVEENGVTEELAEAVIADQQEVSDAVAEMGIELGADADLWVEPDTDGQIIHVRTESDDVIAAVETLAVEASDIVVDRATPVATGGLLSRNPELAEAAVMQVSPGTQGIYVRPSDGVLVIDTLDSLGEEDLAAIAGSTGYTRIEANLLEEPATDSLVVRGGSAMSSCTAAFPATRGSEIGFFSAAHCRAATQRLFPGATSSGTGVAADITAQNYGANADIAFYRIAGSGNSLSRTYYGSAGTARTYGGAVSVGVGFTVCHRGRTTGWSCGRTSSINYQPTWQNACPNTTCNAVFVSVTGSQNEGGDSGGPWLSGDNPIGIHKGGSSSVAVYSSISRIPSGTRIN